MLRGRPNGLNSAAQIADLTEWVRRGAPWPNDTGAVPVKKSGEMEFTGAMKSHWAFQPVRKVTVAASEYRNPIDAFLSENINAVGLKTFPPADARKLIRRATFDLTGLPPTAEEVTAFVVANSDPSRATEAYSKLVERLLQSPHYGERFARHWLDVARYADSNGSEVDHAMSNAWRYRDYVVQAFNNDLPFNQFIREQLAGDLLPNATTSQQTATGLLMLGPKSLAELDKAELHADIVDEQVDTVSRAFMGLTMGCCRCHDHKFDPLPTADYYALAGIFRSTRSMDLTKRVATWTERPMLAPPTSRSRDCCAI